METRANYVLIGAFTLAAMVGFAAFLLWLANAQVNRQFAYYNVAFNSVDGLSTAGAVRYNGLPVGQVIGLELDPTGQSRVIVRIEVDAETPVKTDTVAQLQSQGVTGVSYVALSGGSPEASPLAQDGVIEGKPSPIQSVFEGAPQLLNKAIDLLDSIQQVVDDENRAAVSATLANLASASGQLDRTLNDFEQLSSDLGSAARRIADFTDRLGALADTADGTLTAATGALTDAQGVIAEASDTLGTVRSGFATADALMQNEVKTFLQSGTDLARRVETTVATLEPKVVTTLDGATAAFDNSTGALDAIERAMTDAQGTLDTADRAFAAIEDMLDTDINAIVTDVRGAVTVFSTTVERVAGNVDRISNEVLTASRSASSLVGTLDGIVQENRRQLSNFLRTGLPQLQRLVEEGSFLVRTMERLFDRIERDPARFFLGTQASEFRR